MTWSGVTLIAVIVTALIIFTIIRNKKDRKEFTKQLNSDYPKSKDEEGDAPTEEVPK